VTVPVEHVQPFYRPSSWRAAALAAGTVALLALAGVRLFPGHQATAQTGRVPGTSRVSKVHAAPLRPRSRASVLVFNGNGVAHAAGTEATALLAHGYRHAIPTDASQDYATSLVLFRRGWEGEARRLARDVGISSVAPLDGRISPGYRSYPLVLILGAN
jgi:hypothetical protein